MKKFSFYYLHVCAFLHVHQQRRTGKTKRISKITLQIVRRMLQTVKRMIISLDNKKIIV